MAKCVDRTKVTSMVNVDIAGYGDTIMSGPTTGAGTAPPHQALARVCAARDYACLRLAAGFAPAILRTIHTPAGTADKLTADGMALIYNAVEKVAPTTAEGLEALGNGSPPATDSSST